jgi:hypothetical protein
MESMEYAHVVTDVHRLSLRNSRSNFKISFKIIAHHSNRINGICSCSYRWTGWLWEIAGWISRLLSGESSIIQTESNWMEYTSDCKKKNQKIVTCNRLDLETRGFWPIVPKNFFRHGAHRSKLLWCLSVCLSVCLHLNYFKSWSLKCLSHAWFEQLCVCIKSFSVMFLATLDLDPWSGKTDG